VSSLPAAARPRVFVDTGVLVHCVDDHDALRRDRARAWLASCWTARCGRTSMQVLSEFYAHARRHFPTAISAGDARAFVRRYQHWKPWIVDQATIDTAWAIESRHELPYFDALILAAAQQQECRFIASDRWAHGRQIETVTVIDPFASSFDALDTLGADA
jgi:predicted nucleic acid-binding protein